MNFTKKYDVDHIDFKSILNLDYELESVVLDVEYWIDSDGWIEFEVINVDGFDENQSDIIIDKIYTSKFKSLVYDWIKENESKAKQENSFEMQELRRAFRD